MQMKMQAPGGTSAGPVLDAQGEGGGGLGGGPAVDLDQQRGELALGQLEPLVGGRVEVHVRRQAPLRGELQHLRHGQEALVDLRRQVKGVFSAGGAVHCYMREDICTSALCMLFSPLFLGKTSSYRTPAMGKHIP